MKKALCILLMLVMLLTATMPVAAETDNQYLPTNCDAGDANTDGTVNAKDLLLLRQYLAHYEVTPNYENADIFSDCVLNAKDVLALRKKLAATPIQASKRFAAEDTDITAKLEDIGVNNSAYFANSEGTAAIDARNPFDLCAYKGRVFVSGGEYTENMGPININFYTRTSTRPKSTSSLQSEKIANFYVYNDTLFTIAIDPCTWTIGEYYIYNTAKDRWITQPNLQQNIHCYDMESFDGCYFFSGANVYYSEQSELSRGTVTRVEIGKEGNFNKDNLIDVPFYDRNGILVGNTGTALPRVYTMMVYNNELYAYYYMRDVANNAAYISQEDKDAFGLYKYDTVTKQFDFCEDMDLLPVFFRADSFQTYINGEETGFYHDFQWKDNYVFIKKDIHITDNMKDYTRIIFRDFEDFSFMDAKVIGDKVYLLATKRIADNKWVNYVVETDDFESFRPILHYSSVCLTRSFEYTDGTFFFGLGATNEQIEAGLGNECGRMFRYLYYK